MKIYKVNNSLKFQNERIYKINSIIFILLFIVLVCCGNSCDQNQAEGPPNAYAPCIGEDTREFAIQRDQMIGFVIQTDNTYSYYYENFRDRGNILIGGHYGNQDIPAGEIDTGDGSIEDINQGTNDFRNAYHNGNVQGYVVSCDRFSAVYNNNIVGWSNTTPVNEDNEYRSFVLIGRIRQILGTGQNSRLAQEWCLIHELGHQIAINGHPTNHGGANSSCCIANIEFPVPGCGYTDIYYCDTHICEIYDALSENALTEKKRHLTSASSYHNGLIENLYSNFKITLKSNKSEYIESEKIWLTVTVKNTGINIDSLPYFDQGELTSRTILTDSENKYYEPTVNHPSYLKTHYTIFYPNEEKSVSFEILDSHGDIKDGKYNFNGKNRLKPGNYTLHTYISDASNELRLISNTISFQIEEPSGTEKEILNKLQDIYNMPDKTMDEKKDKALQYKNLLNHYNIESSSYYDQIFRYYANLMSIGRVNNGAMVIDEYIDFLTKKPNSYSVGSVLAALAGAIKNFGAGKNGIVPLFDVLKSNNPNSKLSLTIDHLLNSNDFYNYYLK